MEMNLVNASKNEIEDMLLSKSTQLETEPCGHFSIREHVAKASEQDPQACSPFKSGKPIPDSSIHLPPKKFKRWDCNNCTNKLSTNFSIQNHASNDKSCSISFLGTRLVPLSIISSKGTVPVPVTQQDSNPVNSDNILQSDTCQLAQDKGMIKTPIEPEKNKEILANSSGNSTDSKANPVTNKKLCTKKSRKVRSLAEIIGSDASGPPRKACRPDNDDHHLKIEKENQEGIIAYNYNSGLDKAKSFSSKSKKKFKTLEVVDETSSLMCWLKKTGMKIKTQDNCTKLKNFEGEIANLSGNNRIEVEMEQEKDKDRVIGNFVTKKRTKKPRKCLHLQSSAIVGKINAKSIKKSEKLHQHGINESKIVLKKGEMEKSKQTGFEMQKTRKKKRKVCAQNSNEMDIVELLAKNLKEKHLTNKTLNSNSNLPLQNKQGKSVFHPFNGSGASKTVQNYQIGESSNCTIEHNFDLNRITMDPNGIMPNRVHHAFQYTNNCTYNSRPNLVPVPQAEYSRSETIPATHLLQLMDASSWSSSFLSTSPLLQNPNFAPGSQIRGFIGPVNSNNHVLMPNYFHQNPCMPFRPLPRLGVFGSLLQREITSPKSDCGTQSGYRIGDLNGGPSEIYSDNYYPINYTSLSNNNNNNNNNNNKRKCEESVCLINKNPADFSEIDEDNEYMIGGNVQNDKSRFGEFYGDSNGVVYRVNHIGAEGELSKQRFLYNAVVH